MIAFSTGGLLGDVFLHLIPETFLSSPNVQNSLEAEFIMVEEKRNVILGLALFFGYAAFFLLEKGMRILNGEGGHDHNHGHSHNHDIGKITAGTEKSSTELEKEKLELKKLEKSKPASSLRLAAYMNLISDMSHNFTDGIALAASFYAS